MPNHFIAYNVLIGGELFDFAEVRIKNRNASLTKIDPAERNVETNASGWNEVLNINVLDEPDDEFEVSLVHIKDEELKIELQRIIGNYNPQKTKDTGVKMKIMLTDEIPIYQRARRLSGE